MSSAARGSSSTINAGSVTKARASATRCASPPDSRSGRRSARGVNPNTSNIAFEYIEGEAILLLLNKEGIAASSGSACASGSLEPSHVLRAMNVPYTAAHGAIRFSFSRENGSEDVDRVLSAVPPIIAKLRQLSPFWQGDEKSASQFSPTYA